MPTPTLIYNTTLPAPNNIPLRIPLPNGELLAFVPGITLTFHLLTADGLGNTTNVPSPLGTATLGADGSSVDVLPTTTGQFGFAMLETTAGPTGRSGGTLTQSLFLLFVDQIQTFVYDTAHITGGAVHH